MNETEIQAESTYSSADADPFGSVLKINLRKGWCILAAIFVSLLGFAIWAFFGTVSTYVEGKGIFLKPGGVFHLQIVLYVSAFDGKKIQKNMTALISPSIVKKEVFGYLRGTVIDVSEFPSSSKGMFRILENDKLVEQLSQGGAPIEVTIEPISDPNSPSGFSWTHGSGPDRVLQSGTLCEALIVVDQNSPISVFFPR